MDEIEPVSITASRRLLVCADVTSQGELIARVHPVVVRDRDSLSEAAVLEVLALPESDARSVAGTAIVVEAEELVMELGAGSGGQGVLLSTAWDGSDSWHDITDVADAALARLTRFLLDREKKVPRLHGGAVGGDDGVVLVLGPSGSGKSTLTAHLVASGRRRLLNDEQIALFAGAGLVGGFTRPIAIKRSGVAMVPEPATAGPHDDAGAVRLVTAAELGSKHMLAGRPKLVIIPDRDDESESVTWELLEPLIAAEEYCANNLDLVDRPLAGLEAYGWLAATVPTVKLRYRDASEAVEVVELLIADPPVAPRSRWSVEVAEAPAVEAVVAAAEEVHTLWLGAEALLFHPRSRHVARLNPSAAGVWRTLPWSELPEPAEARDLGEFIDDLASSGFVRLADADESANAISGSE